MKLAEFYGNGRYVKKDKKKRFEWLQHAAGNGFLESQEQLAECYEKGRGVNENHVRAYQWYKKAAAQGSEYGKVKAKEFELLRLFLSHPGTVFTREQLLDNIWGYEYIGDTRTVDVHIKRLREKINDHPTWCLGTVWGVGYKFETK